MFSPSHSSGTPPRPSSPIQTSVIQSTKAYNGNNKSRSRRASVEELNQQNNFSVNGNAAVDSVIRTAVYEESDVEMETSENNTEKVSHSNAKATSPGTQNGIQNGSSHHHPDWEDNEEPEDMGTFNLKKKKKKIQQV